MNLREVINVSATKTAFTVTLTLTVEDARALWTAAAEKAMQAPGMTLSDVLDTLGPREDPSIADCIAMLTVPGAIAGCALDDFSIDIAPASADVIPLPVEAGRLALMSASG